ncbi:MAG TPA: translesion error-prone DNA polymerase V autoproteolytic subunit [Candidatus Paceibacterota bacterium]|nr:translesion error-prone DNA polymerase V autoproteolytic subunit [Candidatus Paceibacterota bacterium]
MVTKTSIIGVYTPATPEHATTPLYASQPAAGFPAPGDDMVEAALDIHDLVVKNPTATFFVRVQGDSMEGAGIFSGDVLVVDRSKEPREGSIVVAAVYGELVVKRARCARGQLILVSEHTGYEPIVVNQHEDCYIWGVVVGSVRQFRY